EPVTIRYGLITSSAAQWHHAVGAVLGVWETIDPNLNVEIVPISGGAPVMIQSLAAGDLDIAQGANTAFLSSIAQGVEITAVGLVQYSMGWVDDSGERGKNAFVVPVDSP